MTFIHTESDNSIIPSPGHWPVVERYLWRFHVGIVVGLGVAVRVFGVPYVWLVRRGSYACVLVHDVRACVAQADLAVAKKI